MTREELIEYLADLEHERWSNWQAYVHNLCIKNEDGSLTIPKEYVDHWNWEIALKYKDLPDNIKESDRKEVYKIMSLFDHMINENKKYKEIINKALNLNEKIINMRGQGFSYEQYKPYLLKQQNILKEVEHE